MSDLTPINNSRVAVTKVFFSSGISLRYMGMYSVSVSEFPKGLVSRVEQ